MKELKAAANLEVMKSIPAANCHSLKADRAGEIAVDISPNWRITFEPDHDPLPMNSDDSLDWTAVTNIRIIEVTDYH
ncbi:MAG: killer suppression protein HigA [Bacteroidetes bacterium]|nr:killer suppression protein HigA [Bacteroidota bacterium]